MPEHSPKGSEADRNLLFGILALQMDFISRDALIAAMHAWVLDKAKPLGRILLEKGTLGAERLQLLDGLVQEHLKAHQHDPQKSLAALSGLGSARQQLEQIADPEVQASLVRVSAIKASVDPFATTTSSVGTPTSTGLRFRILRPHLKGGLGEVFVAHDEELPREVALKQIQERHADNPGSRARFILEAEVTGGLEHPGIVPVYGLGKYADGRPFYAMRFIKGDNLKEAIRRFHEKPDDDESARNLEFRQLLRRFIDVCNAIGYAHSRKVLHRDLKPGNIMLGQYGETLVVDWGLAKVGARPDSEAPTASEEPSLRLKAGSGSAETQMGSTIGTPGFMSPEQALGRLDLLGSASDIYSLGATLYVVLTGRAPITGEDVGAVLSRTSQGDFLPPVQAKAGVPKALDAICRKAMALKPHDRYGSARELAADIEHWLADEPVAAYPEPVLPRMGRWTRKHRTAVTGIAALLVTAVVALGGGLLAVNTERENTVRALAAEQQARAAEAEQRQRAEENEDEAKTQAAIATAVKEFLQYDLLRLASPREQAKQQGSGVKIDPGLKVRDLVIRAAKRIEGKFQDQPLIEAEIRSTLGKTLSDFGEYQKALPQFERVIAIDKAKHGPDHADTLSSMHKLAWCYKNLGRHADALKLNEETLTLQKAKLGPDHPDTLASMNGLAVTYGDLGRYADALKLNEETLALQKAKFGPDHRDTLAFMSNLANSYRYLGRYLEALELDEKTLALRKAKFGPDHADTLDSMSNLAASYAALGRHADALKLFEETLALQKAKLGADHPVTLDGIYNIACTHALMIPKSPDGAKEADLAMTWLKQAVAAGFKNAAQIEKDTDLDALRSRPDFQELLAKLKAGTEAKKK
jgi:eukaryotic-like serine/threonine-protein kinase